MSQRIKPALAAAIAFASLFAAGAEAQEKDACAGFKWSVARERGWFAAPAPAASGAAIVVGRGYAVALQPTGSVAFRLPPERAPKAGAFGATLEAADIGAPGPYQITLSDEAWIDVVQGDARLKSTAFSGQKDCPGVRKSVRFDLKAGALTIQVSNAASAILDLSIAPAQ